MSAIGGNYTALKHNANLVQFGHGGQTAYTPGGFAAGLDYNGTDGFDRNSKAAGNRFEPISMLIIGGVAIAATVAVAIFGWNRVSKAWKATSTEGLAWYEQILRSPKTLYEKVAGWFGKSGPTVGNNAALSTGEAGLVETFAKNGQMKDLARAMRSNPSAIKHLVEKGENLPSVLEAISRVMRKDPELAATVVKEVPWEKFVDKVSSGNVLAFVRKANMKPVNTFEILEKIGNNGDKGKTLAREVLEGLSTGERAALIPGSQGGAEKMKGFFADENTFNAWFKSAEAGSVKSAKSRLSMADLALMKARATTPVQKLRTLATEANKVATQQASVQGMLGGISGKADAAGKITTEGITALANGNAHTTAQGIQSAAQTRLTHAQTELGLTGDALKPYTKDVADAQAVVDFFNPSATAKVTAGTTELSAVQAKLSELQSIAAKNAEHAEGLLRTQQDVVQGLQREFEATLKGKSKSSLLAQIPGVTKVKDAISRLLGNIFK